MLKGVCRVALPDALSWTPHTQGPAPSCFSHEVDRGCCILRCGLQKKLQCPPRLPPSPGLVLSGERSSHHAPSPRHPVHQPLPATAHRGQARSLHRLPGRMRVQGARSPRGQYRVSLVAMELLTGLSSPIQSPSSWRVSETNRSGWCDDDKLRRHVVTRVI